jgi:apolipoprotein D and lipocalin family protein
MRNRLLALLTALVAACTGVPEGVETIDGFELERYLGTWHEIARLDHRFERGLTNVTANYSMLDDGGVRVVNRGRNEDGEWEEAEGKAYFVDSPDAGRLKVSFFGPFYGGYNIVELDKQNYSYAMVVGPNRDYLWILARQPSLDDALLTRLVDAARELDYPVEELIYVEHDG